MKQVRIYEDNNGIKRYGKPLPSIYGITITVEECILTKDYLCLMLKEPQKGGARTVAHLTRKDTLEFIRRLQTWLEDTSK